MHDDHFVSRADEQRQLLIEFEMTRQFNFSPQIVGFVPPVSRANLPCQANTVPSLATNDPVHFESSNSGEVQAWSFSGSVVLIRQTVAGPANNLCRSRSLEFAAIGDKAVALFCLPDKTGEARSQSPRPIG